MDQQVPEEDQRAQRLKCDNNNKVEDISLNANKSK